MFRVGKLSLARPTDGSCGKISRTLLIENALRYSLLLLTWFNFKIICHGGAHDLSRRLGLIIGLGGLGIGVLNHGSLLLSAVDEDLDRRLQHDIC